MAASRCFMFLYFLLPHWVLSAAEKMGLSPANFPRVVSVGR